MKLLFFNFGAYTAIDIKDYFHKSGIIFDEVTYSFDDKNHDDFFVHRLDKILKENIYDAVFSVNYFPLVAECCYRRGIKYLSWSYDNPLNVLEIEKTLGFETNYAFLFDRIQAEGYTSKGFNTVYHLPLAVNVQRLDKIALSKKNSEKFSSQISFVGKLYDSDLPLYISGMSEYQKGFIEAAINVQGQLYGSYLLDKLITDAFVDDINKTYLLMSPETSFRLTKPALEYAMAAEITRRERLTLLSLLSSHFELKVYSRENNPLLMKSIYMGSCRYLDEMPAIFNQSKINLNINLKISQSGIPLRVMDILGSGGFLLSSYQPEIAEMFIDGGEVVMYESIEDAFDKVKYYLEHEAERKEISINGRRKVSELFSYEKQMKTIFTIAGLA